MLSIFKNYAKGKVSWGDYLGLAYGVNFNKSATPQLRKTNDEINLVSKGGIYAWKNWDYAGLFEFKFQLMKDMIILKIHQYWYQGLWHWDISIFH